MKPFVHAANSAKKFGGNASDYIDIHEFMDSSKAHVADHRHRAIFHSTLGCFLVERVFGSTRTNSEDILYSTRDIAEQHCLEDLGHIPTVQDWLGEMPIKQWMGGGSKEDIPSRSAISLFNEARSRADSLMEEAAKGLASEIERRLINETDHTAVQWMQYTPHFNDGDPCVFGVRCVEATNCPIAHDEPFDPESVEWEWKGKGVEIIESISTDLIESAFGDGSKLLWVRGVPGIAKEYHDHD